MPGEGKPGFMIIPVILFNGIFVIFTYFSDAEQEINVSIDIYILLSI